MWVILCCRWERQIVWRTVCCHLSSTRGTMTDFDLCKWMGARGTVSRKPSTGWVSIPCVKKLVVAFIRGAKFDLSLRVEYCGRYFTPFKMQQQNTKKCYNGEFYNVCASLWQNQEGEMGGMYSTHGIYESYIYAFNQNPYKRYPCNWPWCPIGLWDVEDLSFCRKSTHILPLGCEPFAPAALYNPGRILVVIFVKGWVKPQGHSAAERIEKIEKSGDLIGNRTHDLPTSTIVPQPSTLPCVPPATNSWRKELPWGTWVDLQHVGL
jgi:hypothetical protein